MTNLERAVEYFITKPDMLVRSSGKFIRGIYGKHIFQGKSKEFVLKAKQEAKFFLLSQENKTLSNNVSDLEDKIVNLVEKIENDGQDNKTTYKFVSSKSLEPSELDELVHVDNINYKRGQTWHKHNPVTNTWSYSISVMPVKQEIRDVLNFTQQFTDFIKTYEPKPVVYSFIDKSYKKEDAILIFPKQDAHFNKLDIYGNNNIQDRFTQIETKTIEILLEASIFNNLEKITYIVGSDQFNSEWTSLTTKGTPQSNIHSYQDSFKLICEHEITIIENLLTCSNGVEILFIPGNHDEYVGWHLINYLSAYYKNNDKVIINDSTLNTKFERYSNSGIMFNHGDVLKQKDLALHFPIQFKQEWSLCDNYYVFTGDKHTEKTIDLNGITCFQVPALSQSTGKWDNKHLYEARPELQAFLIKKDQYLTNIYKRKLY